MKLSTLIAVVTAISFSAGCKRSTAPSTKTEADATQPNPAVVAADSYDVPSLLGKTYQEVVAVIGPPTSSMISDDKGNMEKSAQWGQDEKDRLSLIFDGPNNTAKTGMFELQDGKPYVDAEVLLKRVKLAIDDPRYGVRMHPSGSPDARYFRVIFYLN